jgi:hypothetical protein
MSECDIRISEYLQYRDTTLNNLNAVTRPP